MSQVPCQPCPPNYCPNPFDRVVISYLIKGGTRIYWSLSDHFLDERPYQFQLQVGHTANPDANDWMDVGAPVVDQFFAIDGEQRVFGMARNQFYRVQLITSKGTYYSDPTGLLGTLSHRDWRLARFHLRAERLRMRNGAGQLGYLLKRRITGTPCPKCLDRQTQEIRDIYCPYCWGTGFFCGYYFPISCVWADVDPKAHHTTIAAPRGTTADVVVKARMINTWLMDEEDVFVNQVTDDRYYVHSVQNVAEYRGVPVAATVEMRLAPASDPVYELTIPQQLEGWDLMQRES